MNKYPKISVILPVYNVERYLRECLDSLRNQTFQEFEILCVDDGSTDGSVRILEEYRAVDSRIHILRQAHSNAGEARNTGLKEAKGEYLSFLDADDFFEPNMLEEAYNSAIKKNADIVVFRVKRYHESDGHIEQVGWSVNEQLLPKEEVFKYSDIEKDVFSCILGYTWDKLIRTDFVRENHLHFQSQAVYNDSYFVYTAQLLARSIYFLNKYFVFQRIRERKDSITDRRSLYINCGYQLLASLKEFLISRNLYELYERDFKNYVIHLLYVDYVKTKRSNINAQMLRTWLDEFEVNEYYGSYYYQLSEYEKLLEVAMGSGVALTEDKGEIPDDVAVIPVVYATDKGYLRYTIVSIISLLQSAERDTFYDIYILVPGDSDFSMDVLKSRTQKFCNFNITCLKMGDEFDNAKLNIPHITTPTFYRLIIPNLLTRYEKCIYLDGDTIVCGDLQEMYNIELNDNYLAGVPAYIYYKYEEENRERLGYTKSEEFVYINAGSIMMNLSKMRKDHLVDRFMTLLKNEYDSQDQDILNVACKGSIFQMPFRFNMMTRYCHWSFDKLAKYVRPVEIMEGKVNPLIIHYADKVKPWNNYNTPFSNIWLSVAMSRACWDLFDDLNDHYKDCDRVLSRNRELNKSSSYRIGRMLTFVPRKFIGGIKCLQEHDLKYTFNRVLVHLRIRPENQKEAD